MAKRKKKKQYGSYLEFLKTRLESENYKNSVTPEEYAKTKAKYDKERFKQRVLGRDK